MVAWWLQHQLCQAVFFANTDLRQAFDHDDDDDGNNGSMEAFKHELLAAASSREKGDAKLK